ncbi:proline-rich transmembrane protein 1-like [Patiria miniata]|uniref:Uncharacterized protein n=1 Tax=Patiria miniata TaxID=46514 RepID=A0A913ZPI4_PATMI|nr:proline-rich transmembrane protein 1-like [Patiria miniata]
MSTEYKQFQNEGEDDHAASYPLSQPQPAQGYAPPPPQYPNYPPGGTMMQTVVPQPQTIISTSHVCQPNDYFGLALFVTICCCLPLGIVGLIKANDVRNRFQVGDVAGAEQASKEAKMYSFWGLGIGIGILVAAIIVTIVLLVVVFNSV